MKILIGALALALSNGCLAPGSDTLTQSDSGTETPDVGTTGDLYLKVSSAWEMDDDNFESHGECVVPFGGTTETCTIRVPEGQLRFSKLKFVFGTSNPAACDRIVFYPAFYLASTDNAFVNYWEGGTTAPAAVDCSVVTAGWRDKGCYWGAAPQLFSSFPAEGAQYFNTAYKLEDFMELDSANSSGYTVDSGNISTCNKMDDPTAAIMGMYEANTMRYYTVRCLDRYEQTLKTVNVEIADEDLSTGEDPGVPANDQYYDWEQTL